MTDASPRFRSVLDRFPAYQPGRTPVSTTGRTHKLSSNESPYGPLPSVVEAIAEAARTVNRYPDNRAQALTEAIADRYGVPARHVAVGCGSVGVTQQLLEAVGEPGAEVLYAWRSFEAYPTLADLAAAESVLVPLAGRDARPPGDGGRDHPAHPPGLRLQPEQPDRHGRPHRRTPRLPRPGTPRLPGGARRGLPRVHPRRGGTRRRAGIPGPAERRRAAHLLQGLWPGRPADRVHDRARAGGGRGPRDDAPVHREQDRAGRRDRIAGRGGRAARAGGGHGQGTHQGKRGAARRRLDRAAGRGQFRLAQARRAHAGVRRRLRGGKASRSARSAPRAPGSASATPTTTTPSLPWPAPCRSGTASRDRRTWPACRASNPA